MAFLEDTSQMDKAIDHSLAQERAQQHPLPSTAPFYKVSFLLFSYIFPQTNCFYW